MLRFIPPKIVTLFLLAVVLTSCTQKNNEATEQGRGPGGGLKWSTQPGTPTVPTGPLTPAGEKLQKELQTWVVDSIIPSVAKAIYLPYDGSIPVKVELMNIAKKRKELEAYYTTPDPKNPGKTMGDRNAWIGEYLAVLGLVDDASTYLQVYQDFRASFAAASYYNGTIRVYTEPGKSVDKERLYPRLVHEVVHLLQDQHYPFQSPSAYKDNQYEASDALIEGHAKFIDMFFSTKEDLDRIVDREFVDFFKTYLQKNRDSMDDYTIDDDPDATDLQMEYPGLSNLLLFDAVIPYSYGPLMVLHMAEKMIASGETDPKTLWTKIHASFKKPPVSMEQVLHPEKLPLYPTTTDAPQPYAEDELTFDADIFSLEETLIYGENTWRSLLRAYGITKKEATDAAAGWDGDRMWVLRHHDGWYQVEVKIRFDSIKDQQEFLTAMEKACQDKTQLTIKKLDQELHLTFIKN